MPVKTIARKASKAFFFEKKKQKTFMNQTTPHP
jgi:hypothetical protein